jgi:hypothetical protein
MGARRRFVVPGAAGAALLVAALLVTGPGPASSQTPAQPISAQVSAGGEFENYLRLLQITGDVALYPWSVRGFSLAEVERMAPRPGSSHPWALRYSFLDQPGSDPSFVIFSPRVRAIYNSAFPHGSNEGPVWAGRGLTTAMEAGFAARWGPVSLTLAPVAFRAENAEFELAEHEVSDRLPFNDWRRPTQIDHPQRPGDETVTRIDPGQSTLRVDAIGLAVGISTANQVWGPGSEYPLIVSNNAPGYLHVFAGTARPLPIGIGRVHGRLVWGRLEQTEFSPVPADSAARFMTGLVGMFSPRGVEGLELGVGRFFHLPWPQDGIRGNHLLRPVETIFKTHFWTPEGSFLRESVLSNQLVSFFARWALPRSGAEVYAEYAGEDHRHNLRDLTLQPDHASAFMIGGRKVWQAAEDNVFLLRGELLNAERSHLQRSRPQAPFYVHYHTRQGHTHRGQIIGSPAALGGSGTTLAVDQFHTGGRRTVAWSRALRFKQGEFLNTRKIESPDVIHTLGGEMILFRGRWDLQFGATAAWNLNRNHGSDAMNLNAVFGLRSGF